MADLGPCPLCGRQMIEGPSIDRHHLIPSCRGGKETIHMHRVCHGKIHHTFTERQLELEYNTVEKLMENDDIQKFVAWVKKKEPEFYDHHDDTRSRRRRR